MADVGEPEVSAPPITANAAIDEVEFECYAPGHWVALFPKGEDGAPNVPGERSGIPDRTDRDEPKLAHVVPVDGRALANNKAPVCGDGDMDGRPFLIKKPHADRPTDRLCGEVVPRGDDRDQLAANKSLRIDPRAM